VIYFDNSATTITKPPEVAEAVSYALNNFGNAGRSVYDAALLANREIYKARAEIARLIGLADPLNVAFTSSSTESLNLVIGGLVRKEDSVITTVTEHNSVLRPLYLTGCDLDFIDCDDSGNLSLGSLEELLKPSTRFLVCTHGSNVTGNITDVHKLCGICKSHNITMILDISQTLGTVPVHADIADIFCFTGHKGLFGPQGTGGVAVNGRFDFSIVKTGGTGVNTFDTFQSKEMPDIFETGTLNGHGIYGLKEGVRFINETGVEEIHAADTRLLRAFYGGIKDLERVKIYGDFSDWNRLPVISINIDGLTSSELAERLWTDWRIAARAGGHCAPLLHKRFGTEGVGMVRFSFSYFNTEDEIEKGVQAIRSIIKSA
jgi:cysteine desulfurase family protein